MEPEPAEYASDPSEAHGSGRMAKQTEGSGAEALARLGYAARGAVSLLVGSLALLAALGGGGGATGSQGALLTLLSQPLGWIVLGAIALGLFGFALWRFLQAALDADHQGREPKAIVTRLGQAVSAIAHAGLGLFAIGVLLGRRHASGEEQAAQDWTRWLLAQPFGRVLVAVVGLAVAGAALGMAHKAWKASFTRHLSCDAATARWVVPLGRAGYAARGIVFLIIGAFLVIAAYQSDPSEAIGLGGALLALQGQPFGRLLFGLVALGLAGFGIFGFVEARYRHIDAPSPAGLAAAARGRGT